MSDTFAEQLRSINETYDASYPPSIFGGGPTGPPGGGGAPVITTLTPSTIVTGAGSTTYTMVGSGFVSTSDVILIYNTGAEVTLTTTVFVSASQLTFTANVTTVGTHSFKVRNDAVDSNSVTLTVVAAGAPIVSSVDQSAFPIIAVLGTGYVDGGGSALEITFPDSGKSAVPATWESDTRMTFELWTALTGTHKVQVVNNGSDLSNIFDFEVTTAHPLPPPPVLTSLAPSSLVAGQATAVTVTITGTGFIPESYVTVTSDGMSGFDSIYVSATEMQSNVMTTYDGAGGGMSVSVGNPPDFTPSNSLPITLTAAAGDAPEAEQAEPPKPRRRGNGTAS